MATAANRYMDTMAQPCVPLVASPVIFVATASSPTPPVIGSVTLAAGTEAASFTRVTASGTIAAGSKSATISNISATITAVVDGTNLSPGQTVVWEATPGKSLDAIPYNPGVGGELAIVTVV